MTDPLSWLPPPDDEIVLSLVEQKMVTHETVRITVQVVAQRATNASEDEMRFKIKDALQRFINADWRFTNVARQRGQTRFEQITVQALARVPERENVQLNERADNVSEQGLELISPTATYSLPFDKVQEINRDLRLALAKQAQAECDAYNAQKPGRTYRVGLIEFADTPRLNAGQTAQNLRAGNAYRNSAISPSVYAVAQTAGLDEDEPDEGAPDLGVTERFWVAAQVTLKADRP